MQLNEKQIQVVQELDRNILLLASAGTGKTNTMAVRIAQIIKSKRALPEEILCLTFTNKACSEMSSRIERIIGTDAAKVTVRTFHSFCYDIIKAQTKKNSDLFTDFIIFDEVDCEEIVRNINTYGIASNKALQNFIALMKQYRAIYDYYSDNTKEDYVNVLKQLFAEEMQRIDSICVTPHYSTDTKMKKIVCVSGADIVESYDRHLAEMHGLDFTDLIVNAESLLREGKTAQLWQGRYTYLNIDEMQDTSLLEYKILSRLFDHNNVLLCGDYFQTIYEWRGSAPQPIIAQYKADYKPLTVIFDKNYRAAKTLLQASSDCLKNLFKAQVGEIYQNNTEAAAEDQGEKITIKEAQNAEQEAFGFFLKSKSFLRRS